MSYHRESLDEIKKTNQETKDVMIEILKKR